MNYATLSALSRAFFLLTLMKSVDFLLKQRRLENILLDATAFKFLRRCEKMLKDLSSQYLLVQSNNRNTKKWCEICSKLTIRTLIRHHKRRCNDFIANFEQITYIVLMFLLLTLSNQMSAEKDLLKSLLKILVKILKFLRISSVTQ